MNGNRGGFTLIEVIVAVVLVGTLAAIAVPRYAGAKDRAYAATMQADLHIAAIYEEQYATEHHGQYFSGTATTGSPVEGYSPSKDVTVTFTSFHILGSQLADWTAVARHGSSSQSCEMRAGITTCTTDNSLSTGFLK
ncbi:MAG TPA: prepilin-type N-terminal cleavage/methylation domain-containing protein [Gemmatimonadaceae bacterium]|jgi:prepilin-type N-terminal cleavage/methylation domain-containing protein